MKESKKTKESEKPMDLKNFSFTEEQALGDWSAVESQAVAIKFSEIDQTVIGIYVGSDEKKIKGNKHPSKLYTFKGPDGSLFAVWGSAILDQAMEKVVRGNLVKIVYGGKVKTSKKRMAHLFRVFQKEISK